MNRIITLECNCKFHQITIEQFDVYGEEMLSIRIYKHKSEDTGKLYKEPELLADVMLDKNQIKFIKSAFKNE